MQDLISKYHILVYENNKEIYYGVTNDILDAYDISMSYDPIPLEDSGFEFQHFQIQIRKDNTHYTETYEIDITTTILVLHERAGKNIDLNEEVQNEILQLTHDKIYLNLRKKINRKQSLKTLLDDKS